MKTEHKARGDSKPVPGTPTETLDAQYWKRLEKEVATSQHLSSRLVDVAGIDIDHAIFRGICVCLRDAVISLSEEKRGEAAGFFALASHYCERLHEQENAIRELLQPYDHWQQKFENECNDQAIVDGTGGGFKSPMVHIIVATNDAADNFTGYGYASLKYIGDLVLEAVIVSNWLGKALLER